MLWMNERQMKFPIRMSSFWETVVGGESMYVWVGWLIGRNKDSGDGENKLTQPKKIACYKTT